MAETPENQPANGAVSDGDYSIHLEFFSGPMDLLLHLVQQREVPIEQVNLAEVCDQYLEIISHQALVDLERAGEYLVIAATLINIKSHALLPNEQPMSLDDLNGTGDPAFYEALRERLKAYELTKRRAVTLLNRPQLGRTTFTRPRRALLIDTPQEDEQEAIEVGDVAGLGGYFIALLKRIGSGMKTYRVLIEPVSVVSYMMKVLDNLRVEPTGSAQPGKRGFISLLSGLWRKERTKSGQNTESAARGAVIGSFLALLELMKRGLVLAEQGSDKDAIQLDLNFTAPSPDSETLESEFDERFTDPGSHVIALPDREEEQFEEKRRNVGGLGRG